MNKISLFAGILLSQFCFMGGPCLAQPELPKLKAPSGLPQTASDMSWDRTAYVVADRSLLEGEDWKSVLTTPRPKAAVEQAEPAEEVPLPLAMKVSSIHQGAVTREQFQWNDGKKTEKWIYQGFILDEGLDGVVVVTDPRFNAEYSTLFAATPFTDLFWLRPSFYRGVRRIQEKLYYYYQVDAAIGESDKAGDELLTPAMMAWIDVETGFPFASADQNSVWIYEKKNSVETGELELPANFREALASANRRYLRLVGRYKASKP